MEGEVEVTGGRGRRTKAEEEGNGEGGAGGEEAEEDSFRTGTLRQHAEYDIVLSGPISCYLQFNQYYHIMKL